METLRLAKAKASIFIHKISDIEILSITWFSIHVLFIVYSTMLALSYEIELVTEPYIEQVPYALPIILWSAAAIFVPLRLGYKRDEYANPMNIYPELKPLEEVQEAIAEAMQEYHYASNQIIDLEYKVIHDQAFAKNHIEKLTTYKNTVKRLTPLYHIDQYIYRGTNVYSLTGSTQQLRSKRQQLLILLYVLDDTTIKQRLAGLLTLHKNAKDFSDVSTETQDEFLEPFIAVQNTLINLLDKDIYEAYVEKLGLDKNDMPNFNDRAYRKHYSAEEIVHIAMGKQINKEDSNVEQ